MVGGRGGAVTHGGCQAARWSASERPSARLGRETRTRDSDERLGRETRTGRAGGDGGGERASAYAMPLSRRRAPPLRDSLGDRDSETVTRRPATRSARARCRAAGSRGAEPPQAGHRRPRRTRRRRRAARLGQVPQGSDMSARLGHDSPSLPYSARDSVFHGQHEYWFATTQVGAVSAAVRAGQRQASR